VGLEIARISTISTGKQTNFGAAVAKKQKNSLAERPVKGKDPRKTASSGERRNRGRKKKKRQVYAFKSEPRRGLTHYSTEQTYQKKKRGPNKGHVVRDF